MYFLDNWLGNMSTLISRSIMKILDPRYLTGIPESKLFFLLFHSWRRCFLSSICPSKTPASILMTSTKMPCLTHFGHSFVIKRWFFKVGSFLNLLTNLPDIGATMPIKVSYNHRGWKMPLSLVILLNYQTLFHFWINKPSEQWTFAISREPLRGFWSYLIQMYITRCR